MFKVLGKKLSEAGKALVVGFVLAWRCFSGCFLNGENILVFSQGSCGVPDMNGVQISSHESEIFSYLAVASVCQR